MRIVDFVSRYVTQGLNIFLSVNWGFCSIKFEGCIRSLVDLNLVNLVDFRWDGSVTLIVHSVRAGCIEEDYSSTIISVTIMTELIGIVIIRVILINFLVNENW